MPGIVTHYVFGQELYAELSGLIGTSVAAREAFLLGNQGPDPFLCLKFLPRKVRHGKLGGTMHTRCTTHLLSAFHEHYVASSQTSARPVLRAYALGFACHFLLDSTVHPLVYAQQYKIYDSGVEGLAQGKKGVVHAAIETELDEYVLWTHCGQTVADLVPSREPLACAKGTLSLISNAFVPVVKSTYAVDVPANLFASVVKLYRKTQGMLDAKRTGFRRRFDYGKLAGASYQQVQAMTHADCERSETPYANSEHLPWPHPFVLGSVVDASFDDLYRTAFYKALEWLPRYARMEFSERDCAAMTGDLNFRGQFIGVRRQGRAGA